MRKPAKPERARYRRRAARAMQMGRFVERLSYGFSSLISALLLQRGVHASFFYSPCSPRLRGESNCRQQFTTETRRTPRKTQKAGHYFPAQKYQSRHTITVCGSQKFV